MGFQLLSDISSGNGQPTGVKCWTTSKTRPPEHRSCGVVVLREKALRHFSVSTEHSHRGHQKPARVEVGVHAGRR